MKEPPTFIKKRYSTKNRNLRPRSLDNLEQLLRSSDRPQFALSTTSHGEGRNRHQEARQQDTLGVVVLDKKGVLWLRPWVGLDMSPTQPLAGEVVELWLGMNQALEW